MKVDILNVSGEKTGRQAELADEVFGIAPNEHVVYLAVKQYLANQRQGTHKAKEKGEVSGSTRKIKRQKGTGGARAGSIKSPLFRGGGRVFGPQPRDYSQKLNKKVKQLARRSALSSKMGSEQIVVIEDFSFDQPRTKDYIKVLSSLNASDKKTLVVLGDYNDNIYLSGRNVPKSQVVAARDLNTYQIMNANTLILSESSVGVINELFF
jgi:large subunit ribosomal protein L4